MTSSRSSTSNEAKVSVGISPQAQFCRYFDSVHRIWVVQQLRSGFLPPGASVKKLAVSVRPLYRSRRTAQYVMARTRRIKPAGSNTRSGAVNDPHWQTPKPPNGFA